MENYFLLRALTVDGEWFTFTIADVPIYTDKTHARLLRGSPVLDMTTIRRGDWESNLYEGDVLHIEDDSWLISYERGFYAINSQYQVKHLYQLGGEAYIEGVAKFDIDFPVEYSTKKNHLFCYRDVLFNLTNITAEGSKRHTLLLGNGKQVPIDKTRQDTCLRKNNSRVFLGDKIDGSIVELRGGRIVVKTADGYKDLATGGILDGYIS